MLSSIGFDDLMLGANGFFFCNFYFQAKYFIKMKKLHGFLVLMMGTTLLFS